MTEELLCHPMVEIGHRHPLPEGIPTAPRTKSMDMRMKSRGVAKRLHDGNHSWAKALFVESGGGHKLPQGFVSAPGELAEKLAVMEEVDSEHLGDGKNPHCVRHVLEHIVVQESGEGRRSLGIT